MAKYLKEINNKIPTVYIEPYYKGVTLTSAREAEAAYAHQALPFVRKIIQATNTIRENYTSVKTTYAKILQINETVVIAKVLLDEEKRTFQKRQFDKAPFEHMHLSTNDFIEINIFTKPGERKFVYKKINRSLVEKKFERKEYFKGLEGSKFFNPLPSENENNL